MLKTCFLVLAALLATVFAVPVTTARAQARFIRGGPPPNLLELDGGFWYDHDFGGVEVFSFSPLVHGRFQLTRALEIDAKWGFSYGSVSAAADTPFGRISTGDSGVVAGDPYVALLYVHRSRSFVLHLGGGVALPVLQDSGGGEDAATFGAAAVRGWWDRWLWLPDRLTIVAPIELSHDVGHIVWKVEGALAFLGDTGPAAPRNDLMFQAAGSLGFHVGSMFVFGGRLQLVWLITGPSRADNAQTAIEPYMRIGNDRGWFAARLTINLDHPLGFAFDNGGVLGFHLGGGFRF